MQVIYGINPLLEVLKGHDRVIRKLVIASGKGGDSIQKILDLAKRNGIPVEFRDRDYLDRQTGGKSHQGVIGFGEDFAYVTVDDIITHRHGEFKNNLILILDGITDPQNLGSLIRTAHCFGANGVIIPKDRSASITATVMKASSGAAGYTPVAVEVNLSNAIAYLKAKGFWIYGADAEKGQNMRTMDYMENIAVVMGSEGKGIRPLIRKKCDFLLSVPMRGKIDSLNVSVAAGIILHEIVRVWNES
ncbi:MAG: 23S rRNA (guanosine(2251)-2'-O)-methyltransferase RlmB [Deltaproteobacteria bacterium]|nr:23S rRNA (guanosine(2251)-2'-O)-methyltransferase RlmB [Deltaproteobacteria bacterium]